MTLMLVFSDTHGDLFTPGQVIEQYPQATHVLHLGDYARDAHRLAMLHPDKIVLSVAGNCDFNPDPDFSPQQRVLEIENFRIFMTHGHGYGVKNGYGRLATKAKALSCQLALFGHTHVSADMMEHGQHLLNPGSLSQPKGMGGPGYALVEVGHGLLETRLMFL